MDANITPKPRSIEKRLVVVYGLGLLALVLLSIWSNFILKEQVAREVTSLIKRTVQHGDYRETILTLNESKLVHFKALVYYGAEGNRMFSLPPKFDPGFATERGILSRLLYVNLPIDLYFDDAAKHKTGAVLFIFGRFEHVPYAVGIWLFFLLGVIPLLRLERKRLAAEQRKEIHWREESSRADLARRVRHDIRSPFGALQIATQDLNGLPEPQKAIIRSGMARLGEIISELEMIRKPEIERPQTQEPAIAHSILALVQEIVREKRLQLPRGMSLTHVFAQDAVFLFCRVHAAELKRTLSNLIDNAVEASEKSGAIFVRVAKVDNSALIQVTDEGKGIPDEEISLVTSKGFTRKANGSGLGLFYARKTVEAGGGTLTIKSAAATGTTVSIHLPLEPSPYIERVVIPARGQVVILDDQDSSHLSWNLRLNKLKDGGAIFSLAAFKSPAEFLAWHRANGGADTLYLFDYDLGEHQMTGLDLACELNLRKETILVTGHYDSEEIQRQCAEQGIRLLPKSYLPHVALESM